MLAELNHLGKIDEVYIVKISGIYLEGALFWTDEPLVLIASVEPQYLAEEYISKVYRI